MSAQTTLKRIQTDPESGYVSAFFQTTVTIGDDSFSQPWKEVKWPLNGEALVDVTLSDGTVGQATRSDILAAVVQIADSERLAQG